jgi:hypothetical protein
MTTAILVGLAGCFVIGGAIRHNPWLWFLAGACMWGLGAWWIHDPIVDSGDPVNDIMLVIAFVGGLGMMLVGLGWRTVRASDGSESSGFNFRLPQFLGGQSEEDESAERQRSAMTSRARRDLYRERADAALRGRRGR